MKLPVWILAAASIIFLSGIPTASAASEVKKLPPETKIYETGQVDIPPVPTRRILPDTTVVERKGKDATCILMFVVTPKGRAAHIVAAESNNPDWAEACIEALQGWRFTPAKKKGELVHCRLQVPMDYKAGQ